MSIEEARLRVDPPTALPRGTRLGEFELLHVLGVGGFGIVYLAFDHALEREVAVKEYMPASLVGRTQTLHVSLRSQSDAETFALGLRSFVNEAKMLARFDHPSLLKVLRFWEANGTAYMAMPVLRGRTAKEARQAMQSPPDEAWLRALLEPLLGAIERLHSEGVYHRDIAPDNIQIEADGHPVLLDFGAARRVISDQTHTLTAILKPAYAPIEQYAEVGSVKQGPWTDLYALGATLHFMLLGRPPLPSTARAVQDDLSPLAGQQLPGCSEAFLNVIDWMLAPRPADRPQSAAQLREVLAGRAPPPRRRRAEPIVSDSQWDSTLIMARPRLTPAAGLGADMNPTPVASTRAPPHRPAADDAEEATMVMPRPGYFAAQVSAASVASPPRAQATQPARRATRSRAPLVIGSVLLLALVATVALWPRGKATPVQDTVAVAALPVAAGARAPSAAESTAVAALPPERVAETFPTVTPKVEPEIAPGFVNGVGKEAPAAESPPPAAANPVFTPAAAPLIAATPALTPPARPISRAPEKKPPAPASRAAAPSNNPSVPVAVPVQAASPAQDATVQPTGKAAVAGAPSVAGADVAAESVKAVATGPEARCSGRNALSRFVCMERECLRSEFASHADCKKWRSAAPARE